MTETISWFKVPIIGVPGFPGCCVPVTDDGRLLDAAAPEGECNGCNWGWGRYQNQHGVWLHRNATDTLGVICWKDEGAAP